MGGGDGEDVGTVSDGFGFVAPLGEDVEALKALSG